MARPGEFEFFSTRSGLPSGTLTDHKMAYYAIEGYPTGTLQDREYSFWLGETGLLRSDATYVDARFAYFKLFTVDDADIDSMMVAFYASPPAP